MNKIIPYFFIALLLLCACDSESPITPDEESEPPQEIIDEVRSYPYSEISDASELDSIIDITIYDEYASGKRSVTFAMDSNLIYGPHDGIWTDSSNRMLDWSRSDFNLMIYDGNLFTLASLEPSFGGNHGPLLAWRAYEKEIGKEVPLFIERPMQPEISVDNRIFTADRLRLHCCTENAVIYSTSAYDQYNEESMFETFMFSKIKDSADIPDFYISGATYREMKEKLTDSLRNTFGDTIDLDKVYYPEKHNPRYILIDDKGNISLSN